MDANSPAGAAGVGKTPSTPKDLHQTSADVFKQKINEALNSIGNLGIITKSGAKMAGNEVSNLNVIIKRGVQLSGIANSLGNFKAIGEKGLSIIANAIMTRLPEKKEGTENASGGITQHSNINTLKNTFGLDQRITNAANTFANNQNLANAFTDSNPINKGYLQILKDQNRDLNFPADKIHNALIAAEKFIEHEKMSERVSQALGKLKGNDELAFRTEHESSFNILNSADFSVHGYNNVAKALLTIESYLAEQKNKQEPKQDLHVDKDLLNEFLNPVEKNPLENVSEDELSGILNDMNSLEQVNEQLTSIAQKLGEEEINHLHKKGLIHNSDYIMLNDNSFGTLEQKQDLIKFLENYHELKTALPETTTATKPETIDDLLSSIFADNKQAIEKLSKDGDIDGIEYLILTGDLPGSDDEKQKIAEKVLNLLISKNGG